MCAYVGGGGEICSDERESATEHYFILDNNSYIIAVVVIYNMMAMCVCRVVIERDYDCIVLIVCCLCTENTAFCYYQKCEVYIYISLRGKSVIIASLSSAAFRLRLLPLLSVM
eukprot:GHVS01029381.1.p1 GENE.GHVS01029381.1~~GHVS01029381.1.p1  ORF type:complete len:113 (+),score=6.05 GHVS01029381.1:310-648(+)